MTGLRTFFDDTAWNVIRWFCLCLLLFATVMKLWSFQSSVAQENMNLVLSVATVLVESSLVFILVYAPKRRSTRLAVAVVFGLFFIVSFYEGAIGKPSCGCFGQIRINPWITCAIDLLIVVTTVTTMCPIRLLGGDHKKIRRRLILGGLLLSFLACLSLTFFLRSHSRTILLLDSSQTPSLGDTVVLQPEKWLGEICPVLPYCETDLPINQGLSMIALVRDGCPQCQKESEKYLDIANKFDAEGSACYCRTLAQ